MSEQDKGDKWAKVEQTAKPRGKVAGRSGAGKGEAQRLKGISAKRAREARQYLETVSPSQLGHMLTGSSKTLTAKQRAYAYHVAQGATKAEAYRQAGYASTRRTLACKPYELIRDERIQREIEAYRLAAEASKHRTAEDLRSLVIQTLVQQVIDPDCPPAVRTQAAKTLGNVTEVAAFTERRESVVHHSSDKLRAQILEQMQALMGGRIIDGDRIEHDADSLLSELASSGPSTDAQNNTPDAQAANTNDTPRASD